MSTTLHSAKHFLTFETKHQLHRILFISIAVFSIAAQAIGLGFNPLQWPLLASFIVLFLGVPHGAFDVALAKQRWSLTSNIEFAGFLVAYVAIAGVVVALWWLKPDVALPLFLAMAAYHFGGDWKNEIHLIPRTMIGATLLCAPALFYRNEVIEIFSWITPLPTAQATAAAMAFFALPLLQASALIVLICGIGCLIVAAEIAVLVILSLASPPLSFFLIYFCGLHSIRHTLAVAEDLNVRSFPELIKQSLPYAPLAIIGTILGATITAVIDVPMELLGVVFIVLAALTAPHMLLVDLKQSSDT